MIQDWSDITIGALQDLWAGFLNFIPKFIGALIVFTIGWFIAVWIGRLIAEVLKRLKFDAIFDRTKWDDVLKEADFKMKMSDFIGGIIKWVLMIVFLLVTIEILGLGQFAGFLKAIVSWLPNLVVAAAIFMVAVVIADFSDKLVKAIASKMRVGHSRLLGGIVKSAIWIFAVLAILYQIGVAVEIVQTLVQGFVALLVISSGLAFGLGGKDLAKEMLGGLKGRLKE